MVPAIAFVVWEYLPLTWRAVFGRYVQPASVYLLIRIYPELLFSVARLPQQALANAGKLNTVVLTKLEKLPWGCI